MTRSSRDRSPHRRGSASLITHRAVLRTSTHARRPFASTFFRLYRQKQRLLPLGLFIDGWPKMSHQLIFRTLLLTGWCNLPCFTRHCSLQMHLLIYIINFMHPQWENGYRYCSYKYRVVIINNPCFPPDQLYCLCYGCTNVPLTIFMSHTSSSLSDSFTEVLGGPFHHSSLQTFSSTLSVLLSEACCLDGAACGCS